MRAIVGQASTSQRLHRLAMTIERDPAEPTGEVERPTPSGFPFAPAALLQLQRTHGNRAVQHLIANQLSGPSGPSVQRAIKRKEDGTYGEAGWTRLENLQWVWKKGAEGRWNAISAMYAELESLSTQLQALAGLHDQHPRIRRAYRAMFDYTVGENVITFDMSQSVLEKMTTLRDRAQAILGGPPVADDPGVLTPRDRLDAREVKRGKKEGDASFESRKDLVATKNSVNTMFDHMDSADKALGQAKTVWARYQGTPVGTSAITPAPSTTSRGQVDDLEDVRLYIKDAWSAQQEARQYSRYASKHPYVTTVGMAKNKEVEDALKKYTDWWKKFGAELSELDRAAFTIDRPKPTGLGVSDLKNEEPGIFRSLVILGRLTLKDTSGSSYNLRAGGGNQTFAFKQTEDWELHIHQESTKSYERGHVTAHYKSMSEKYDVGFNMRNPVGLATLHKLGVNIG